MPRYHFYDLETSGLNPAFNQILQFAVVETDADFREISRENFRIHLSQDQIPHPKALWVNHTHPDQFQDGLSEYEAIKKIHDIMNKPNTINLGYNTLSFDDEFLRFSFFRNLLPSYTHQWANGCSRLDIYPIVLLAYRFRPDLLKWPMINEKVSFKLEHLVRENGISSGNSHDALIDVLDTIALARILKSDREFWQQAVSYFDKKKDEELIAHCPSKCAIANFSPSYGFLLEAQPGASLIPAIDMGRHQIYKNQIRWLRLDTISFQNFPVDELLKKIEVFRKKPGEPPFFFSYDSVVELYELENHDQLDLIKSNLRFLSENPAVFLDTQRQTLNYAYAEHGLCDINAMLYKMSFPSPYEETIFQQFHLINDARKVEIASALPNHAHKELVTRLLGKNRPDLLSPEKKIAYERYIKTVFTATPNNALQDHQGHKKLTLMEALVETEKLLCEKTDAQDQDFLLAIKSWYLKKREEYAPSVPNYQTTQVNFFGSSSQPAAQRGTSLARESGQRRERQEV